MRNFLRSVILGLLLFLNFSAQGFAQDKLVAVVNNDVITQKDLDDFLNFMRMEMSAQYPPSQLESKIESMKADLLNRLIEDRLILQEAKKYKILVDEARVRARINQIRSQYATDNAMQEAFKQQGLVQADVENKIREQFLMYNMIEFKIRSKIVVNPAEVTQFYQENLQSFNLGVQKEFYSISIADPALTREIHDSLKKGQPVDELSRKYPVSVNMLVFGRSGQFRQEIEDALTKLDPGGISAPVRIDGQEYIFIATKIIPARQQSLDEVREQVYTFLFNKKMEEEMDKWLAEIKLHSYIKLIKD